MVSKGIAESMLNLSRQINAPANWLALAVAAVAVGCVGAESPRATEVCPIGRPADGQQCGRPGARCFYEYAADGELIHECTSDTCVGAPCGSLLSECNGREEFWHVDFGGECADAGH